MKFWSSAKEFCCGKKERCGMISYAILDQIKILRLFLSFYVQIKKKTEFIHNSHVI